MLRKYTRGPLIERFWAKVDPCRTDGCAIWVGALSNGYGKLGTMKGVSAMMAHHVLVGVPLPGWEWDHLCRNPACVWPEHLELVTHQVNIARGATPQRNREIGRAKTHCKHGHPLSGENLYVTREGRRGCKACNRNWKRRNVGTRPDMWRR